MTQSVCIVDYGLGNLYSIKGALEYIGADIFISSEPNRILSASKLILPGVGAFGKGMANLSRLNLISAIKEYIASDRPFLGICLGMQLLMDSSEELGTHEGLGVIKGTVTHFPFSKNDGASKIPHVGWNQIKQDGGNIDWTDTVLKDIKEGSFVYFTHSYVVVPSDISEVLTLTKYNNFSFCSGIKKRNIYGFQFHPEKSGKVGLNILRNFIELA